MLTADGEVAFDVKIASALAPKMMLSDVVFAGVEAKVVNAFVDDAPSLTFDVPKADVRWVWAADELRVVIPYQVDISQELKDNTKLQIVRVRVLLRVDYHVAEDMKPTDEDIRNFVGISAFMHSWPYLRAEVESLTAKLRLPPLVLPVMLSGHAHNVMAVRKLVENDAQPAVTLGHDAEG